MFFGYNCVRINTNRRNTISRNYWECIVFESNNETWYNVCCYLEKSQKVHWSALKRILKYLKSTQSYGSLYNSDTEVDVIGYSDANYTGDINRKDINRKEIYTLGSTLFFYWKRNSCVVFTKTKISIHFRVWVNCNRSSCTELAYLGNAINQWSSRNTGRYSYYVRR